MNNKQMAGYFSNHSQSRFLANSQGITTTTPSSTSNASITASSTTTLSGTASHTSITSNNNTTNTQLPNQVQSNLPSTASATHARPTRVPSRHFSTSLSGSGDEKSHAKDKAAGGREGNANGGLSSTVHPLRHTWVFWFRQHRSPGKITNYEEGIKKISAFSSVESFWSLWTHLHTPSSLLPTTDYLLFHSGIRRPVWEDPLNLSGGKWIIRLKKGVSDRLWEDLVLAVIGDQFDECVPELGESGSGAGAGVGLGIGVGVGAGKVDGVDGETADGDGVWPEICGCTISVRQNEDILTVWNKTDSDPKVKDKINSTIRRVLNLSAITTMEYKSNNDSMQDKSSFRITTQADRSPHS